MSITPTSKLPTRIGFLLINDFTLISMSSAVEPLRMANRIVGEDVYHWRTISQSGEAVTASDGLRVDADYGIDDLDALVDLDLIIVCGGRRIEGQTTEPVIRWLKMASKNDIALGAVCTGSYVLAKAGLLDQHSCSIHWENIASVNDIFPRVNVSRRVYTIDGDRFTSSGGTAPVDMMLHLVRERCGGAVSAGVAEQFVYDFVRQPNDRQRVPLKHTLEISPKSSSSRWTSWNRILRNRSASLN